MGREVGERFKRKGIYVYLWLIHVEIWQKITKFCKAIILQLKKKKKKKEINLCKIKQTLIIHECIYQLGLHSLLQWKTLKANQQKLLWLKFFFQYSKSDNKVKIKISYNLTSEWFYFSEKLFPKFWKQVYDLLFYIFIHKFLVG